MTKKSSSPTKSSRIARHQLEPKMHSSPQVSRLLSLPYEIRMHIWQYAIPSEPNLRFCPCLNEPPRSSETDICLCRQGSALATHKPSPISKHVSLIQPESPLPAPNFRIRIEELFSELHLTCRQILADTAGIAQPQKNLTLCSPTCLTSLMSTLAPNQLASISKITISIDLRVFRPPPTSVELASFHNIWKCIYNTRMASDRAIRKFYASPLVERMNADIIEPALDFYSLGITTGRPFNRQEIAYRRYWSDPTKGEERVAELRRIVGNRSREGLPVPGRWRGDQPGGMIGRNVAG